MKPYPLFLFVFALFFTGCATVSVPMATSSWERGRIQDYELQTPGLGWSQRYEASQGWVDVYLYDLGQKWDNAVDIARAGGPFASALQDIKNAGAAGYYNDVRVLQRDTQIIDGLTFQRAVITYRMNGKRIESHLLMTVFEGKLLKLRVSLHSPASDASKASIAEVVAQHLAPLRKLNAI